MRKIRNYAKQIALVMSVSILFVSCSANEDSSTVSSVQPNNVSGQDLFKGIFFSEGALAKDLSNYQQFTNVKSQLTDKENKELADLQDDIVVYISKHHPAYFEEFKKSIASKNPVVIRSEIAKSKIILKDAVLNITKVDLKQIESKINLEKAKGVVNLDQIRNLKSQVTTKQNYSSSKEVAIWPVAIAVLVVAVVLEVAVYVDIAYWSIIEPVPEDPTLTLENDEFIKSISELDVN